MAHLCPWGVLGMILVTGTKRSGTSMWMQILIAAGFTNFGSAFPANWGESIKEANSKGFFESKLCLLYTSDAADE